MSTLRTFNLQNPDSGTVNIEMDQGGNTLMTGIATVRGAAHFTSTSGSDAVGIGTDITAYKLDVRVTGAEAGLRVYNPDTSSNASGILRLGNDDNQNSAFLRLNGANNSSAVGGAANLVLGTGTAREVHLATNGTSRLSVGSDGKLTSTRTSTTAYDSAATTNDSGFLLLNHGAAGHATLQFQSLSGGTAQTGQATISSFNETAGSKNTALTFGTRQSSDATIRERLRITSAGNIGIGLNNPGSLLHISGADAAAAKIKIEDNNNGFAASEINVANGGRDLRIAAPQDIYFQDVDTGEKHLYIESGGNIGIGTDAPAAGSKLHLHDTSACRIQLTTDSTGFSSSDGTRLMVDSSNNFEILNREAANIEFFTNNTERLRITSGGHLIVGSGYADFQSGIRGESSSTDPYKLVFQNQYSNGYTDEKLKLYLFNSGNTRQGFGPGPNYDLQYHCSGSAADQARHRFYTDNVLRMEIHDAYGGVTKPTQPAFRAYSTGFSKNNAWQKITFGTENYDIGGHYDHANNKFIAPVAGRYIFYAGGWSSSTSADSRYAFCARVNGGSLSYIAGAHYGNVDSPLAGYSVVHNLAANDYVELLGYSAVATTWGGGSHVLFWGGYLLG